MWHDFSVSLERPGGSDGLQQIRSVDRADQPSHTPTEWTHQDNEPGVGGMPMRRITALVVFLVSVALCVGWGSRGGGGEHRWAPVRQYAGHIQSIKIDQCGLQPGTCEGSIVLKLSGGQEVTLAIRPGTWMKREDQLVLIEDLRVGDYVTAHATSVPGEPGERAITILVS
jgi:hypothetical protein